MESAQLFPVGIKDLLEYLRFKSIFHLHIDLGRKIRRNLSDQSRAKSHSYHRNECGNDLSGLMSCDYINKILGYKAGNKRKSRSRKSQSGIKDHLFPVFAGIPGNPENSFFQNSEI